MPVKNEGIIESSSGFHVLEIHVPTIGYGLTFVIFFIVTAACLFACLKKLKRQWSRPPQENHRYRPHPFQWADTPTFSPMHGMPMTLMNSRFQELPQEETRRKWQDPESQRQEQEESRRNGRDDIMNHI